jgi:dipeptidyl aminopeptidase/acylaminoacyl peptidase
MPHPLTPATLVYEIKTASDPQLSPDARHVLYALVEADPATKRQTSQLWRCDIDGAHPRRLTWTGERNGGGRWSPDGTAIAFVSDRPGQQQHAVLVMPTTGAGEARELARHRQGIEALAWSPDGTRLAYTTTFDPENPDEAPPADGAAPRVRVTRRDDYKQDNRGYLGERRQQIFVVDVRDGMRRQLTREPVDHHFPAWSPDGRRLAAQVPNRGGMYSQLALVDGDTGATTLVGPRDGAVGSWSWSPSGERIIFTGGVASVPRTPEDVVRDEEVTKATHPPPVPTGIPRRGGAPRPGQRQIDPGARGGPGRLGGSAAELAAPGRHRRGPGATRRPDERRAGGAAPPAPRESGVAPGAGETS